MIASKLKDEAGSYQKKEIHSKVPVMKITRMPSVRFTRNLLRKLSAGTDLKKQPKKSRSVKIPHLGSSRSSNREVSSNQSESSSCDKSTRVLRRTPTLRTLRVLSTKSGSLRAKRSAMDRRPDVSSGIQKATCSSTLKSSKFPDDLNTQPGESAAEVAAVAKVCSYSYCSLHGHDHASPPPLKRLISERGRALKNQKGLKLEVQPSVKAKKSGVRKKETQIRNMNITTKGDGASISCFNTEAYKDDAVSNTQHMETGSFSGGCVEPPEKLSDSSSVGGALVQPVAYEEEKNERSKIKMENHSNFKFWNLLYQHMVTDLAADVAKQPPLDGVNVEELGENKQGFQDKSELGSCQDFSGNGQAMKMEGYDEGNPKLELRQSDAIKIVQQAFNKLLSEIPDDLSDDQSTAGAIISEEEIVSEMRPEDKDINIWMSPDSAQYEVRQDLGEPVHRVDYCDTAELTVKQDSDKQTPKRWSNLKKLIILKRFVKELENVRNLNLHKGRLLLMQHSPEAERVLLRHQTIEGRRSSEEWMLDYALRQVISMLGPSQKRKVDLLVQAFETVIPGMNISRLSPAGSPHTAYVEATESSAKNANEGSTINHSKTFLGKTETPKTGFGNNLVQVSDSFIAQSTPDSPIPKGSNKQFGRVDPSIPVLNEETIDRDLKKEEARTLDDGNRNNDSTHYVNDQLLSSNLSSPELEAPKPCDAGSLLEDEAESTTSHKQVTKTGALPTAFESKKVNYFPNETEEDPDNKKNPTEIRPGNAKSEHDFFQRPPPEKSTSNCAADVAEGNNLEKQRYTRLWHLIHKQMDSTSDEEKRCTLLGEEAYKEEGGDATGSPPEVDNIHPPNSFAADHDTLLKNYSTDQQNIELQHREVIKLVEEAIDKISLSETQDEQEAQDKETSEKNDIEGEERCISICHNSVKDVSGESNAREEGLSARADNNTVLGSENNGTEKDGTGVSNVANKYRSQGQKNWSNMKNLILIRRFVKSLEKVKAFNLQGPRFLPQDSDRESEKVHLRHQDMEGRKNSDEWMLDYALQQVVAKLTPARKRRVELLVEAFETVVPTLGN